MEVLIKLSDAIKTLKSMAVPLVRKLPSAQPERLTDYSFEESCTECPAYDTENHRCPRFNQVIRTALKDANLEPCENCISRQAAIDALDEQIALCDKALKSFGISMRDEYAVKVERTSLVAFREKLEYLQPAQPETATVTIGRTRGSVTMWYECDACGEPVDQKDNYCRKCGRKLKHE